MFDSESYISIRYSEVDQMGIVYYSRYFEYYEIGRIKWITEYVMPYQEIENKFNIGMPTIESLGKFITPSRLGDNLKLITSVRNKPTVSILFNYELYNNNKLVCTGYSKNVFVSKSNFKPFRSSQLNSIIDKLFDKGNI